MLETKLHYYVPVLNGPFSLNIPGRVRFSSIYSVGMLGKRQLCCSTGVWPGGFNRGNMGSRGQGPMEKPDGNFGRGLKQLIWTCFWGESSKKRLGCWRCCFSHREDPDGAPVLFAADEFSSSPREAKLLDSRGLHKHHVRIELRCAQAVNFLRETKTKLQSNKMVQKINRICLIFCSYSVWSRDMWSLLA